MLIDFERFGVFKESSGIPERGFPQDGGLVQDASKSTRPRRVSVPAESQSAGDIPVRRTAETSPGVSLAGASVLPVENDLQVPSRPAPSASYEINGNVPDDPATLGMIAPYRAGVEKLKDPIGKLGINLTNNNDIGAFVTKAARSEGEKALGRPAQLAFFNKSGFRSDGLKAGTVSAYDIYTLMPFDNKMVAADLTGAQIQAFLGKTGRSMAVSGDASNLDPGTTYTVITDEYVLNRGGRYADLAGAQNIRPLAPTTRDAVLNYILGETSQGRALRSHPVKLPEPSAVGSGQDASLISPDERRRMLWASPSPIPERQHSAVTPSVAAGIPERPSTFSHELTRDVVDDPDVQFRLDAVMPEVKDMRSALAALQKAGVSPEAIEEGARRAGFPLVDFAQYGVQSSRMPTRESVTSRVVEDDGDQPEPSAGRVVAPITLALPEGYGKWEDVPGTTLARSAVGQFGREKGIPTWFLADWINTETTKGTLRLYSLRDGRSIEGKDLSANGSLNPDNTATLKGELPFLRQLESDWKNKGESIGERIARDAQNPEVAPGEMVIGNAARIIETAARPLGAINALGNSLTQAQVNAQRGVADALTGARTAKSPKDILSNIPQAIEDELRGKDSGVTNPAVDIQNDVLGSSMPSGVKPVVNFVTDFLTSPDNLLLMGVGTAARLAGKATKGVRSGRSLTALEDAALARFGVRPKLEPAGGGRVKLTVENPEGGLFELTINPKQAAAQKAVAVAQGERGFLNVPSLDEYTRAAKAAGLTVLDIANSYKAFKSAYDVSAAGRQGLILGVNSPIEATRAFFAQFKAMKSEEAFSKMMRPYLDTPMQDVRERSGLWLSTVNNPEEVFAGGNLAKRIPGVEASERGYNYYLDRLRIHSFDSFYAANPNATANDLKEVARYINWASGRGSLGKLEGTKAAKVLQQAFWSPRLNISRGQALLSPVILKSGLARKYAARQLATFITTGVGFLGLAKMAGSDVETDPRSTDFGRIVIGSQHYDIFGGFTTQARYLAQFVTGQRKPIGSDVVLPGDESYLSEDERAAGARTRRTKTALNFVRTRLSPALGLAVDLKTGYFVTGEQVTKESLAESALLPLSVKDVVDAFEEDAAAGGNGLAGAAKALPAFVGVGVQTISGPRTPAEREMKRVAVSPGRQTPVMVTEGETANVPAVVKRALEPIAQSDAYQRLATNDEKRELLFRTRKFVQTALMEGMPEAVVPYQAQVYAEAARLQMRVKREVKEDERQKLLNDRIMKYFSPAFRWNQRQGEIGPPLGPPSRKDFREQRDVEEVFDRKRAGADAWLDEMLKR